MELSFVIMTIRRAKKMMLCRNERTHQSSKKRSTSSFFDERLGRASPFASKKMVDLLDLSRETSESESKKRKLSFNACFVFFR